jgi:hypothetical protein
MKEIWKEIPNFSKYMVSNFGRVKHKTKGIKEQHNRNYGYYQVQIYDDNMKKHNSRVHRLVAMAFIPNLDNKPQVNHIDENKANNHVDNLEWITNIENCRHGSVIQRRASSKNKPIIGICLKTGWDIQTSSIKQFCMVYNCKPSGITKVLKGIRNTHHNFIFKYL